MAFAKRTYKDNETVITAANLNAIQDELLRVASGFDNGDFDGEPGEDGVGIASIQQTTTSTADGGSNIFTVTLTSGATAKFTVRNGSKGSTGATGSPGNPGANGNDGIGIASIKQTTTSLVDGGNNVFTVTLTNGATATFTVRNGSTGSPGATGNDGKAGEDGKDGKDGVTPAFSIGTVTTLSAGSSATATITGTAENPVLNLGIPKGKDGADGGGEGGTGVDGEDGGYYIPTVSSSGDLSWSPTKADMPAVQTVNIKGDKGDTGAQGLQGIQGIQGIQGEPGAKGEKGDKGDTGAAGYTPQRGTDYWTSADKAEMVSSVLAALPTWTGGSY